VEASPTVGHRCMSMEPAALGPQKAVLNHL
jgi:hypothetical protein